MLAKAERIAQRSFEGETVHGRQGDEQRRNGRWRDWFMDIGTLEVIAAKIQTVEEQAEVRDSLKSVWCKGNKDECNSGNG